MRQVNLATLPATYRWYWICPLRRWWNFWQHTAPIKADSSDS